MDEPASLPAVLDGAVGRAPAHPLLRCAGRDTTVSELQDSSRAVAAALRGLGIDRGDRVALMMANVPEFVSVWFGIIRAGAIEVPVHTAHRGPLLAHILNESQARVLFCDDEFLDRLAGLELPALERIVVRGWTGASPLAGVAVQPLDDALGFAPGRDLPVPGGDDVSCILYTSGTTGPSKGVVLTHRANLWLANANVSLMEYTSEDVLYTAFPLFHVNAKFTSVTSSMLVGARLVLDESFTASRFWDRMREERVTSFNYMGGLLSILAKQPADPRDREHLVTRAYGGGCPPGLWVPFEERFGLRLHEHYGMTEVGIAVQNTRFARRPGAMGKPAPYFEIRLADEHDRQVPAGEVGEVQIRPREPGTILREYWRRPQATLDAFRNLWFHTGDRARMDDDGFLFYVDRLKDSIRRRGENISSFEVEAVLAALDGVAGCAAYGVPSELGEGEEDVMVAVECEPGRVVDLDTLIAHCEQNLARFAMPRYVRFMNELPRNASQRTEKFRLREEGVTADTIDRGARASGRASA